MKHLSLTMLLLAATSVACAAAPNEEIEANPPAAASEDGSDVALDDDEAASSESPLVSVCSEACNPSSRATVDRYSGTKSCATPIGSGTYKKAFAGKRFGRRLYRHSICPPFGVCTVIKNSSLVCR